MYQREMSCTLLIIDLSTSDLLHLGKTQHSLPNDTHTHACTITQLHTHTHTFCSRTMYSDKHYLRYSTFTQRTISSHEYVCVCMRACVCVCARVCACVCICVNNLVG